MFNWWIFRVERYSLEVITHKALHEEDPKFVVFPVWLAATPSTTQSVGKTIVIQD